MSRILAIALAVAGSVAITPASIAAPAPAAAAKPLYTSAETPLGDLLDDPAAKAILVKHLPDVVNKEGIDMARGMTLKQLQNYAADQVTDAKLAVIDAELAKLPAK